MWQGEALKQCVCYGRDCVYSWIFCERRCVISQGVAGYAAWNTRHKLCFLVLLYYCIIVYCTLRLTSNRKIIIFCYALA